MKGSMRGGEGTIESPYFYNEKLSHEHAAVHKLLTLENDFQRVQLSSRHGLLESIFDKLDNTNLQITQSFYEYTTLRSGAYLFRPEGQAMLINADTVPIIRICHGHIVDHADIIVGDFRVQIHIVKSHKPSLRRRVVVQSSVVVRSNREIVLRFNTDVASAGIFDTNNGMEFQRRHRKDRGVIAPNFYPSVAGARLVDNKDWRRLTVTSSHTTAVTSLNDGVLEFMVHRSLAQDDGRGLAQPVNDQSRAIISMHLQFEATKSARESEAHFRRVAIELDTPLQLLYGDCRVNDASTKLTVNSWKRVFVDAPYVLLQPAFSPDLHLLTLAVKSTNTDEVVMRLQNLLNRSTRSDGRVVLELDKIFDEDDAIRVSDMRETTLSAVYGKTIE